ncbi:MAG TPA: polysaccharide deacetylase family protein [Chthoniobacterales bacterium]
MTTAPYALIVSVHDVSPITFEASRTIVDDLRAAGVPRASLLVVPNHHRRGHFLDDPALCDWMKARAADGYEMVVHGYFHERDSKTRESVTDRLITEVYTAGEGEFFDISEAEADEKLGLALAEFGELGLSPTGFIAPAWLLSVEAKESVRKNGFRYTTTLRGIVDLHAQAVYPAPSLVYSVRSAWRRQSSIVWNPFLKGTLAKTPVIRLGIHPPDWKFPAIRAQILRFAASLARERDVTTYGAWVSAQAETSWTGSEAKQ